MTIKHLLGAAYSEIIHLGDTSINFTTASNSVSLSSFSLQKDDFVLVSYGASSQSNITLSIKDPSSVEYTMIGTEQYQNDTYDANLRTAWKFMDSSPDSTISVSSSSVPRSIVIVSAYRGVDKLNPIVSFNQTGNINTGIPTPATLSPSIQSSMLATYGVGTIWGTGNTPFGSPDLPNFLSYALQTSLSNGLLFGASTRIPWTGGNLSPSDYTGGSSSTTNSWCSISIELRPN